MGVWGQFVLRSAFQPIFAFEEGKLAVVAFEGLLRPFQDGETLPPMVFFNGLPAADRLPVEKLAHTLHLMNAAVSLPADASIFVNFDPSVFVDAAVTETTIREMRATLSGAGIDPRRVVCEVTERETISQQALFALVAALRASGFRIAVDDYGADNSDMGRIRDIHPDIVKFDAAWIAQLMESGPGYALLERMVSTFAGQGIRVVFEGIEQGWQVELAEKSGTAMVQGYALARPELAPTSFATTGKTALAEPLSPGEPPGRAFPRAPAESDTKSFGRRTRPQ